MIERLPRYAETELQRLCAKGGALCHAVDEDETGWDRLIEFPIKPFAGPADTRPPPANAFAQVKSVKGSRLSCKIKLSNALRAAQSPQPWFIMLMTAPKPNREPRVYVVHFWDELIRRTLEAVRQAENSKRPLHKVDLTITFQASDEQEDDLVEWMQSTIDAVGPEYEAAKRAINRTAGYEDGYGTGLVTIEANNEEIVTNFLGLGNGLPLSKFTFTPSRFGISSPVPQVDASSGTVHITPQPAGEIEMHLRVADSVRPIVLHGHVYGPGIPGLPADQRRLRFSAGFADLVWKAGGAGEFSASLDGCEKCALAAIEDYLVLKMGLAAGPIDVKVWSKGKRVLDGTLDCRDGNPDSGWEKLFRAVRLLRSITGHERAKVSLKDLSLAPGLKTLTDVVDAPSFRTELPPSQDAPVALTAIVYWSCVEVGEYGFYALVEHVVFEDIPINGKRRITAKPARVVESYVLATPSEADRKMMAADYERHVARLSETGAALGLGNLVEQLTTAQSPAPRSTTLDEAQGQNHM